MSQAIRAITQTQMTQSKVDQSNKRTFFTLSDNQIGNELSGDYLYVVEKLVARKYKGAVVVSESEYDGQSILLRKQEVNLKSKSGGNIESAILVNGDVYEHVKISTATVHSMLSAAGVR